MAIEQTPHLEALLEQAQARQASEIYLLPDEPVSFRIRGQIERGQSDPLTAQEVEQIALAAVGKQGLDRIRQQAGGCVTSCSVPGVAHGRATITSVMGQWSVTVRIFPEKILDPKAVGMPEAILKAAESSHGLVVFAGEPGSGKTTNALSFLEHINATQGVQICTIEDPVTTRLTPKRALVRQHEVGVDVPDTLAALRHVLNEGVDVLYLNVLRNIEEVTALVTAADIGCLVVTVLHAASPEEAVERMADVLKSNTATAPLCKRLAGVLRAVSVQRLLPRAVGKGVVAAYDVLIPDDQTRRAIIEGTDLRKCAASRPSGGQTLAQDIERLCREGVISEATAKSALAEM
ncbi:MAG: Flp pilus assembly complex ATPase component TadA [Phycisphaeraceae bacterium]|nr:Flp pilus assembly complex ATPase component TadA [Phycisphaeraceae bacterium]